MRKVLKHLALTLPINVRHITEQLFISSLAFVSNYYSYLSLLLIQNTLIAFWNYTHRCNVCCHSGNK